MDTSYAVPQSHLPTHTKKQRKPRQVAPVLAEPEAPRTQRLWDLMRAAKQLCFQESDIPADHWLAPVEAPAWWLEGRNSPTEYGVGHPAPTAPAGEPISGQPSSAGLGGDLGKSGASSSDIRTE